MLEACPPGRSFCGVRGASFCVTHEADDPFTIMALAHGQPVYDLNGRRIEWPPQATVVDEDVRGGFPPLTDRQRQALQRFKDKGVGS